MRTLIMMASAVSLAIPATTVVAVGQTSARHHYRGHTNRHVKRCRHSSGTTGLVAGGVGGAVAGRSVLGHGLLGTAAGAVGGAFAGRAIDRTITAKDRCR